MGRLLDLQRQAGNRAISRSFPLQRYDTGEHAQMGSDAPIVINGVTFTRKQLTAMGDLYDTAEDMEKADPKELRQLRDDIEAQTKYYKHEPGGHDVPETKGGWDEHTHGRYLELAKKNSRHFAPGVLGSENHKQLWLTNHLQALHIVRAAVINAPRNMSVAVPQHAQAVNAFGNHFLTDAFTAGHLIPKDDVMDSAKRSFDSLEHTESWWQVYFYRNDFTDRVADIVMADPRSKAFDPYQLKLIAYRDIDAHRLSEFLFQFANRRSDVFYSNIVKAVHDELNHATEQSQQGKNTPIRVANHHGETWDLPGDTTLSASPKTLEIINAALAQAEANLDAAAMFPSPEPGKDLLDFAFEVTIPKLVDEVWAYTPYPIDVGKTHVETVRRETTDMSSMVAARRFAAVILDHLPEIIEKLQGEGILADREVLRERMIEAMEPGP